MKSNRVLFKPPLAGLKSPNLQVKGSYSLLLRSQQATQFEWLFCFCKKSKDLYFESESKLVK
jgi:hypothetical protein